MSGMGRNEHRVVPVFKCAVKDDCTLVDAIVETLKNLLTAVVALVPSSVAQIAGMGRKSQYHFGSSAALSGVVPLKARRRCGKSSSQPR